MATSSTASMAFIGANGQIMLGKQFAGQQVTVEQREPCVWLINAATLRQIQSRGYKIPRR
jgi:hypothetical protein